jgi:hypothetical protein
MIDLAALAASAVTVLVPFLSKAAEKGVGKLAESAAGSLFESLKTRLQGKESAKEALDDLARQPEDADTQATLRVQLRKALASDPELAENLKEWLAQGTPVSHTQIASVTGDQNKVTQITGSHNIVG